MSPLEQEAAKAALKKMFDGSYFDICTIDQILRMSGGIPPAKEYKILRTLHCVNWRDMSPALRIELPRVIQLVLESQPMVSDVEMILSPSNISKGTKQIGLN